MKKYIRWLSIILAVAMLAGCSAAPDTTEDPLSAHTVDSLLPFATRAPQAGDATQTPGATLQPGSTAISQDWQNEAVPGNQAVPATPTPASAEEYTRLELGSEGQAVTRLQKRLIELGYMGGSSDGQFGEQTKTAVKRFQSALGLSQTGIATVSLQEKLFLSSAPKYSGTAAATPTPVPQWAQVSATAAVGSGYTNLVRGDSGDAVQRMQARLIELNYLAGTADGQFGSKTEDAVMRFQERLGLVKTGVATSAMQEKLFMSSAPTAAPTAKPTAKPTPTPAQADASEYSQLEPGDTGSQVRSLQYRLKELGYMTADATGNYYSETTNAVRLFQQAIGLSQTGIATSAMQELLFSTAAPIYRAQATATPSQSGGYANLQYGDKGEEVRNLQKRLIELHYLSGKADGDYGVNTATAVKRFQAAIGYNQTGVASAALQSILFSSSAPTAAPSSAPTAAPTATPAATPVQGETSGYRELAPGDTGEAVKQLQARLGDLNYFDGEVGGNYLTKTTAAVKLFQAAIGMAQTGVASAEMQKALFSTSAPAYTGQAEQDGTLRKGDTGSAVKGLQARLIELHYLSGKADGDYGNNTAHAIQAFQAAAGLSQTGEADQETQAYLYANNAPVNRAAVATPTPAPAYAQLLPGDTGAAVKKMQQRLKELGYFDGELGGNYLTITTAAVKRFQAAVGMEQTGIATAAMQQALFSSAAPAYSEGGGQDVTLKLGDTGEAVKSLQARLIELKYLSGKADGDFGAGTEAALRAFQAAAGLSADGVAGAQTQAYLYASNAPVNTVQPTPTPAPAPGYDNGYQALAPGDTGNLVKQMQARLTELGYFDGEVGGNYLTKTTAAVKLFQQAVGMSATGEASSETLRLLYSDSAPHYTTSSTEDQYEVLSKGDSGSRVARLQNRLVELGWLTGEADGDFGGNTAAAIGEFQYRMGMIVDGIASIELQEYLFAQGAPAYVEYVELLEGLEDDERVTALQARLIELGYLTGEPDGDYGQLTADAVRMVQERMGTAPAEINGAIAGIEFQRFLFSENAVLIAAFDGT